MLIEVYYLIFRIIIWILSIILYLILDIFKIKSLKALPETIPAILSQKRK